MRGGGAAKTRTMLVVSGVSPIDNEEGHTANRFRVVRKGKGGDVFLACDGTDGLAAKKQWVKAIRQHTSVLGGEESDEA